MVNANRKGREAENRLSTWFAVHGYPNELVRLAGINDRGDLWLPYEHDRISVKNHANMLAAMSEAIRDLEGLSVRCPDDRCHAVIARPGLPANKWYVVRTVERAWPARWDRDVNPEFIGVSADYDTSQDA
jgi:hypothetical protein